MDLLDKLRAIEKRRETFADASAMPGATVMRFCCNVVMALLVTIATRHTFFETTYWMRP